MINRISEIPFWGPEEQIRKFIDQHDDPKLLLDQALLKLGLSQTAVDALTTEAQKLAKIEELIKSQPDAGTTDEEKQTYFLSERSKYIPTQQTITQQRIENLDILFQKQLIWSYGRPRVDDAYFYQYWCPIGTDALEPGESVSSDPKWQMELWGESVENTRRDIDRTFKYTDFQGYTNSRTRDEMPIAYDARGDQHAKATSDSDAQVTLDIDTLRHNIMKSYLEVSEWLGDGALQYGSHNGYVSRKMSLAWLFNAIKALINWKLASQDKWAEKDIYPLNVLSHHEHFLSDGEQSDCGISGGSGSGNYTDEYDLQRKLDSETGRCSRQVKERANRPDINGVLKVRGNEFHYGERADFYTHNSFIGECRFFHNARFLGQTTFDQEINGTALRSRWADLAEFKEADQEYQPGTLVMFGGEKEITLSRNGVANAIVTTKPGLVLNGENQPGKIMVGIALTGTVPVRVSGKVNKFDRLVADKKSPGMARAKKWYEFWKKPIAIALENWPAGGKVNCITKMEF